MMKNVTYTSFPCLKLIFTYTAYTISTLTMGSTLPENFAKIKTFYEKILTKVFFGNLIHQRFGAILKKRVHI